MSTMLERAKVWRESVDQNLKMFPGDQASNEICCFYLQQTVEFTLKYLAEVAGERQIKGHKIEQCLSKLKIHLPMEDSILEMADKMDDWYDAYEMCKSFYVTTEEIERVMKLADDLISYASAVPPQDSRLD